MAQFSFQRLDDGQSWGVKVSGNIDEATKYAGREVSVQTRNGNVRQVKLGSMVAHWNAGRAAVYNVAGHVARAAGFVAPVTLAEDQERNNHLVEIADDIASRDAYVAETVNSAWAARTKIGDTKQGSFYDVTFYLIAAPGLTANEVRSHLARNDGQSMYAYGTFGGYSTIGDVHDNNDGTFAVESVYHIGD